MTQELKIIREAEAIIAERVAAQISLIEAIPFLNWFELQCALLRDSQDEISIYIQDLKSRISETKDGSGWRQVVMEVGYIDLETLDSMIHKPGSLASPSEFISPIYRAYVKSGGHRNYDLEKRRNITIADR